MADDGSTRPAEQYGITQIPEPLVEQTPIVLLEKDRERKQTGLKNEQHA